MRAKRLWFAACAVVVVNAAIAASAGGTIVSTGGQVTKIAAPPSVVIGALESDTTMHAFDELQCVRTGADLPVDITQPGRYDSNSDLTPGTIPAGTLVSSHLIHADSASGTEDVPVFFTGQIVVSEDIIGIAVLTDALNATDVLGAPGTVYPKTNRRLNLGTGQQDFVIERDDLRTVRVHAENHTHLDQVRVITKCTPPRGGQGCTPGYWKQSHHFDSYPPPYTASTTFASAFGRPTFGTKTLPQVAATGGGGLNALGRHAVAALLNAAHPDVSYDLTVGQVITLVQNAIDSNNASVIESTKNRLEQLNQQGCPLN